MNTIKAVFFDAAGTLIKLREPVGETYARFGQLWGLNVTPDRMNTAFIHAWKSLPVPLHEEGHPPADDDRSWWRSVVTHAYASATEEPLAEDVIEGLFRELYEHFGTATAWRLCEDVPTALDALSPHFRLLVLSNFDRRLHPILEGLSILHHFSDVIISSEVGASKPHTRMFEAALKATSLQPSQCLHVGDDPRCDLDGATKAGIACFLVNRPQATLDDLVRKLSKPEI